MGKVEKNAFAFKKATDGSKTINKLCAFTLAEVTMAKRMSDKTCLQEFVRMSKPKAPTNIFDKLCAFTLAEVLITLAIIGVVAALSIPAVVKNYQKQQAIVKLKKVYASLNAAIQMSSIENGPPTIWSYGRGKNFYEKNLKKYLKVLKTPGNVDMPEYHWLNGTKVLSTNWITYANTYKIILSDGTLIGFEAWDDSGVTLHVDINGYDNPPNIAGKDYFLFKLFKNEGKLVPYGGTSSGIIAGNDCIKTCKGQCGMFCVLKIFEDGWEIKYDW